MLYSFHYGLEPDTNNVNNKFVLIFKGVIGYFKISMMTFVGRTESSLFWPNKKALIALCNLRSVCSF